MTEPHQSLGRRRSAGRRRATAQGNCRSPHHRRHRDRGSLPAQAEAHAHGGHHLGDSVPDASERAAHTAAPAIAAAGVAAERRPAPRPTSGGSPRLVRAKDVEHRLHRAIHASRRFAAMTQSAPFVLMRSVVKAGCRCPSASAQSRAGRAGPQNRGGQPPTPATTTSASFHRRTAEHADGDQDAQPGHGIISDPRRRILPRTVDEDVDDLDLTTEAGQRDQHGHHGRWPTADRLEGAPGGAHACRGTAATVKLRCSRPGE